MVKDGTAAKSVLKVTSVLGFSDGCVFDVLRQVSQWFANNHTRFVLGCLSIGHAKRVLFTDKVKGLLTTLNLQYSPSPGHCLSLNLQT